MKSGNLNFLELSGPLQARNGIALPFYIRTVLARPLSQSHVIGKYTFIGFEIKGKLVHIEATKGIPEVKVWLHSF
jgi:hypothetical protein